MVSGEFLLLPFACCQVFVVVVGWDPLSVGVVRPVGVFAVGSVGSGVLIGFFVVAFVGLGEFEDFFAQAVVVGL